MPIQTFNLYILSQICVLKCAVGKVSNSILEAKLSNLKAWNWLRTFYVVLSEW